MSDEHSDLDVFADAHHELTFYVRRCIRYHMHREAFFSKLNRTTSFIGVVFGSAAIASLFQDHKVLTIGSAAIVTVFSALDLVIGTGNRAALHGDLRKRYLALEVKLLSSDLSAIDLKNIEVDIRKIEADEPPALAFLNEMASNEVIRSMYSSREANDHVASLPWWKRVTANVIDWDVSKHIGMLPETA